MCTLTASNIDEGALVLERDGIPFGFNGFAPSYTCGEHQQGVGCEVAAANCNYAPVRFLLS